MKQNIKAGKIHQFINSDDSSVESSLSYRWKLILNQDIKNKNPNLALSYLMCEKSFMPLLGIKNSNLDDKSTLDFLNLCDISDKHNFIRFRNLFNMMSPEKREAILQKFSSKGLNDLMEQSTLNKSIAPIVREIKRGRSF